MVQSIVIEINLEFEDNGIVQENLEEALYDSVNEVVEDFAPDKKDINIKFSEEEF